MKLDKNVQHTSIFTIAGVLAVLLFPITSTYEIPNNSQWGMKKQSNVVLTLPNADNWEKQLETGLIALEANCDQNYTPFNREKVVN